MSSVISASRVSGSCEFHAASHSCAKPASHTTSTPGSPATVCWVIASSRRSAGPATLQDELLLHVADRQPPPDQGEDSQERDVADVGPALEAEHRVADQLDAVEQRIEVAGHLCPFGQAARREERARHEEQRSEQPALPVGEALDRL